MRAIGLSCAVSANAFGSQTAVDNVSLRIEHGQLVCLLGPSGCGKTTILRLLAGFTEPTVGEIAIGERVVSAPARVLPPEQRNVSMVFQSYALWPHMTVAENVAYGLELRKLDRATIAAKLAAILATTQLAPLAERYPAELSGGQQQRVSLARALVVEPDMLLLDEPLSNLDANLREEMRFEVRRLHQAYHYTTVYVTHDQSEAMTTADLIAVMNAGRIEQLGSPTKSTGSRARSSSRASSVAATSFAVRPRRQAPGLCRRDHRVPQRGICAGQARRGRGAPARHPFACGRSGGHKRQCAHWHGRTQRLSWRHPRLYCRSRRWRAVAHYGCARGRLRVGLAGGSASAGRPLPRIAQLNAAEFERDRSWQALLAVAHFPRARHGAGGHLFAPCGAGGGVRLPVTSQLIEAAKKEGKAVWYTAVDLPVAERIAKAFEAKYPGIAVRVERSGGERIFQRIGQEYASNIHAVDVVNSSDAAHFIVWKRDGILAAYLPQDVASHYPAEQRDPDGLFASWRVWLCVIGYNTKLVKADEAPEELRRPARSEVVGQDREGPSRLQRYHHDRDLPGVARHRLVLLREAEPAESHAGAVLRRPAEKISPRERAVMADGNEYNLIQLKEKRRTRRDRLPQRRHSLIIGPSAVMKDAPNPNAARLLQSFMFSAECQQLMVDWGGLRSFHAEVKDK